MTARMVIQGREVPKVHLLMTRIDDIEYYIDSMPVDHPDLPDYLRIYDALMAEMLAHRRAH